MKKFSVAFLTLISIFVFSCKNSDDEKARNAIRTYLNENLDDMSTYEPVKFGVLDTLPKINLESAPNTKPKDKTSNLQFLMFHSYRLKRSDGSKHLIKEYFKFNANIEVINSMDAPFSEYSRYIEAPPDTAL
jgi:hypothetical protein